MKHLGKLKEMQSGSEPVLCIPVFLAAYAGIPYKQPQQDRGTGAVLTCGLLIPLLQISFQLALYPLQSIIHRLDMPAQAVGDLLIGFAF